MTTATSGFSELEQRLARAGISRQFLKFLLPSWWDVELAESDSGLGYTIACISGRLGISCTDLSDPSVELKAARTTARFKTASNQNLEKCVWTPICAQRIANMVSRSMKAPWVAMPETVQAVLDEIQARSTDGRVQLQSVQKFLEDFGIPAVYCQFDDLNEPKVAAVALLASDGRPVIVLAGKRRSRPRLVFDLLHELGHHFHRHCTKDVARIDFEGNDRGKEEDQANGFARDIQLMGKADEVKFSTAMHPTQLKGSAERLAAKLAIDVGAVVEQYSYQVGDYAVAGKALKALGLADTERSVLNRFLAEQVDVSKLGAEDQDYLNRILGA